MGRARELAEVATAYTSGGLQFRNRIINGDMRIDQRNAGASVAANPVVSIYTIDRWLAANSNATSRFTIQQNAGAVTPPVSFSNYLGITSTSAYSITSSDEFALIQRVEGFNVSDFGWGTVNAQTVTLSFWIRSSLTGSFGVVIRNANGTRSYPVLYTVSAANTWEYKTVTIPGETSGTWLTTNGSGLSITFGLGIGSTLSGASGAWANANTPGVTGATSVVGTSGATFYITGVQLEAGSVATPFERRPIGQEEILCKRYYEKMYTGEIPEAGNYFSNWRYLTPVSMMVSKRVVPTITVLSQAGWPNGSGGTFNADADKDKVYLIGLTGNALNNTLHSYTFGANAEL
jgi:hypothetical protein